MSLNDPAPGAAIPPADVTAALGRVLRSVAFARSPQLQRFLGFVVEETLAGRGERLKEYVIGLEVFSRPASYDPRTDSLVRVEARRLRVALASYYSGEGRDDTVVVELHKGCYVPSFRRAVSLPSQPPTLDEEHRIPDAAPATTPGGKRAAALWKAPGGRFAGILLALAALAAAAAAGARFLRSGPVRALTERDLVVLAGFANSTNDRIFDETLRQGLATDLEQSPFLNIVSERRVGQVLKLMGRAPSDRLDREHARGLCLRAGAKVVIDGSIDKLGSRYVVGLTARDCATGDDLVHVQEEADRKEGVLRSLSAAASRLRGRLGESLASIRQFGTPVEEATTASLEALQAYSVGRRTAREKGSPADIPFYMRALELDPNFAAAHAALGVAYMNVGQPSVAAESLQKAYQLREHVSERERYRVSAYYYQAVTGELDKASEVYELWKQSYPREFAPCINLGLAHLWLGEYEKALAETQEAVGLEPTNVLAYTNLAALLIKLGRADDAEGVLKRAASRNLVSGLLRMNTCYLAFLRGDSPVIERQLSEVRDKPGDEGPLLSLQSDTEAYYGRQGRARELSKRAAECALRAGSGEAAAGWLLNAALREAEFGNRAAARRLVREALAVSDGRDAVMLAALASARSGDGATADRLLARLDADARSSVIAKYWLPTIRAAREIAAGHAPRALRLLDPVSRYELGSPPPMGLATLYPVYLRGEAWLMAGNGPAAAREFEKVVDHPGLVLNFPLGALSHLQLARARKLSGDPAAATRARNNFLSLWQSADPDIPILRQARGEQRALR